MNSPEEQSPLEKADNHTDYPRSNRRKETIPEAAFLIGRRAADQLMHVGEPDDTFTAPSWRRPPIPEVQFDPIKPHVTTTHKGNTLQLSFIDSGLPALDPQTIDMAQFDKELLLAQEDYDKNRREQKAATMASLTVETTLSQQDKTHQ